MIVAARLFVLSLVSTSQSGFIMVNQEVMKPTSHLTPIHIAKEAHSVQRKGNEDLS